MVFGRNARRDVDRVILRNGKNVKYLRRVSGFDRKRGERLNDDVEEFFIKVQCTVQNIDSRLEQSGLLKTGSLRVFFRWEYEVDALGNIISPKLLPSENDRIVFLGREWETKELTPAVGEDSTIIGYDGEYSMISDGKWIVGE